MYSTLFWMAIAMIAAGAAALNYQRTGDRKRELLLIFGGATLVVCGIALARDVLGGSSSIVWILSSTPQLVAHSGLVHN